MICELCREEIPAGDEMNLRGKTVCEDCYIDSVSVPKTCDVAAVYSAKKTRAAAGHTGTEGLTDLQKKIVEYVVREGKATREQLAAVFSLNAQELQTQLAVLRHCELLRAAKIDGDVYVVPMDSPHGQD